MAKSRLPQPNPINEIISDDDFDDGVLAIPDDKKHQIQDIPLSFMKADAMQARQFLPKEYHELYHLKSWTPEDVLLEMFKNVVNTFKKLGIKSLQDLAEAIENGLIPALKQDPAQDDDASPMQENLKIKFYEALISAHTLYQLYKLAQTILQNGQIYPITVLDRWLDKIIRYLIETGERRYWANCLLNTKQFHKDFKGASSHNGTIPCLIVESSDDTVFRQAQENMVRQNLSAVGIARQASQLLWVAKGYQKPETFDSEFYKTVLDQKLTLHGVKEKVLRSMGDMSADHFYHYLDLLKLSPEATALADHMKLAERQLRPIVNLLNPESHYEMVLQVIEHNLTSAEIEALCTKDTSQPIPNLATDDTPKIPGWVDKTWRNLTQHENFDIDIHGQALLKHVNGNRHLGRAWGEALIELGEKLVQWMNEPSDKVDS